MNEPWEGTLSSSRLVELHRLAVEAHGGARDPPRIGCLDQCLGSAWTAELYIDQEQVQAGLHFAGYLLFYLARNHRAVDGNKRLAWLGATEILLTRGLDVDATAAEVEQLVNAAAVGDVEPDGVVAWLASRVKGMDPKPA
jgi:prophage maintenance system killer protein